MAFFVPTATNNVDEFILLRKFNKKKIHQFTFINMKGYKKVLFPIS